MRCRRPVVGTAQHGAEWILRCAIAHHSSRWLAPRNDVGIGGPAFVRLQLALPVHLALLLLLLVLLLLLGVVAAVEAAGGSA
jgi:hypothetical protein